MSQDAIEVADHLHSAVIHLLRLVRLVDVETGLTPARLSALSVLVFGGPRTVGDLAAIEQVRPPTMSGLVAQMVNEGLVVRSATPQDRRMVIVSATPRGRQVLQVARGRRVTKLAQRVATLNAADQAVLDEAAALMERLAGNELSG